MAAYGRWNGSRSHCTKEGTFEERKIHPQNEINVYWSKKVIWDQWKLSDQERTKVQNVTREIKNMLKAAEISSDDFKSAIQQVAK